MEINKLILRCIKQDRNSQKEFYMLTSDRLMNISRRYTNNLEDAKDVLQNAYVKIFNNLESCDLKNGNIDGWLSRIVVNEALQLYRKKQNDNNRDILYQQGLNELSAPEVIDRLNAEDILKLMRQLPEGYRVIFNMNVVEGFSHKEISEQLGIGESTSRSQLSRARELLREIINKQKKAELC